MEMDIQGCPNDYVQVFAGERPQEGYLIEKICFLPSAPITVPDSVAYVQFITDRNITGRGFSFIFDYTDEIVDPGPVNIPGCPTNETLLAEFAEQGTLISPNHPLDYPDHADCSWIIQAPENMVSICYFNNQTKCISIKLTILKKCKKKKVLRFIVLNYTEIRYTQKKNNKQRRVDLLNCIHKTRAIIVPPIV